MRATIPKHFYTIWCWIAICCFTTPAHAALRDIQLLPGQQVQSCFAAGNANCVLHRHTSGLAFPPRSSDAAAGCNSTRKMVVIAAGRGLSFKAGNYGAERKRGKMNLSDNEDDEEDGDLDDARKLSRSGYFSCFFSALSPHGSCIPKLSPICRHFLYCASCRYIALRVIRI